MNVYKNIKEIEAVGLGQKSSIINDNCLDVMKFIKDKSIDMILCDLPYG